MVQDEEEVTQEDQTEVIEEMKLIGFQIIDYRHKSETLYVIGGIELEKQLQSYVANGLKFRQLKNGNKTTEFKSAWCAKVKK